MKSIFKYILLFFTITQLNTSAYAQKNNNLGVIVSGYERPQKITIIKSMSCIFCRNIEKQIFPNEALRLQKKGYEIEIIMAIAYENDTVPTAILSCTAPKNYTKVLRRLYDSSSIFASLNREQQEKAALARAADYGLTTTKLSKCLNKEIYNKNLKITNDAKNRYKYTGTPSIYLNDAFIGHTTDDLKKL